MQKLILNLSVAVLIICMLTSITKTHASFLEGFEDIPLMEGMSAVEDAGINFDAPSGSIVQTYAESTTNSSSSVFKFYEETMPQLGWAAVKKTEKIMSFTRDNQLLTIELIEENPVLFKFETKPSE